MQRKSLIQYSLRFHDVAVSHHDTSRKNSKRAFNQTHMTIENERLYRVLTQPVLQIGDQDEIVGPYQLTHIFASRLAAAAATAWTLLVRLSPLMLARMVSQLQIVF